MKLPRFNLRGLLWLVLVVGLGTCVVWLSGAYLDRSVSYQVAAEYQQLPESDERLLDWLKQQPGVVPNTVRARRNGSRIEVGFIQSQNLPGQPEFPSLETAAAQFGYEPPDVVFLDVPR